MYSLELFCVTIADFMGLKFVLANAEIEPEVFAVPSSKITRYQCMSDNTVIPDLSSDAAVANVVKTMSLSSSRAFSLSLNLSKPKCR